MSYGWTPPPADPEEHDPECLMRQHFGAVCSCSREPEQAELDERLELVDDPSDLDDREYARWLLIHDMKVQADGEKS